MTDRPPTMGAMFTIQGDPMPQPRPRTRVLTIPRGPECRACGRTLDEINRAVIYDPPNAKAWKAEAANVARRAMGGRPLIEGPVEVRIDAVFALAKSHHRKTIDVPAKPRDGKPDAENVAKAVLDAMTGVVYRDDAQVWDLRVRKITGGQEDFPLVKVRVVRTNNP